MRLLYVRVFVCGVLLWFGFDCLMSIVSCYIVFVYACTLFVSLRNYFGEYLCCRHSFIHFCSLLFFFVVFSGFVYLCARLRMHVFDLADFLNCFSFSPKVSSCLLSLSRCINISLFFLLSLALDSSVSILLVWLHEFVVECLRVCDLFSACMCSQALVSSCVSMCAFTLVSFCTHECIKRVRSELRVCLCACVRTLFCARVRVSASLFACVRVLDCVNVCVWHCPMQLLPISLFVCWCFLFC